MKKWALPELTSARVEAKGADEASGHDEIADVGDENADSPQRKKQKTEM